MIFSNFFKKDKSSEKGKSTSQSSKVDYFSKGMSQYDAGNYAMAVECFQKAVAEHPENENAYLKLADSYVAMDKNKEALSALYKLLALNPDCALAHEMLKVMKEHDGTDEPEDGGGVTYNNDEEFDRIESQSVVETKVVHAITEEPYDPHLDLVDYSMPNVELLEDDGAVKCHLKRIIQSQEFADTKAHLPVVLGEDDNGKPCVVDLAEMPHILISGQTGFGKTTLLNVMLTSLLFKKHPADIKFVIMGDKRLSLSSWDELRNHFLAFLPDNNFPVIVDDNDLLVKMLNSLCVEMDSRFDLLKKAKVRNVMDYNHRFCQRQLNPECGHRYLPNIVVFVYELAGFMSSGNKEIEMPLCRLSQMANAVGIHLVISSNRSDVDVFSTQLKNNFPSRISFKVARGIESNAILGVGGAQNLRCPGEMLLVASGGEPKQLQGAYVSDDDVDRVVRFIGGQQGYSYGGYQLPEYLSEEAMPDDFDVNQKDEFFDDAARLVVASQFGSTSLLQRKLQLGYNRAGRLIEQLEAAGIVGPYNGSKARDVLVKDEKTLEALLRRL